MTKSLLAVLAVLLIAPAFAQAENINFAVKRALATEVSNVSLTGSTLADALDYLRDISGANINVHWKILEDAKISKDTPVSVRLRAVPMRRVLQFILDDAGGSTPLTYYIDQGVIEITTREAADSKMITRIYDVGDLVVDVPDFEGPDFSLQSQTTGSTTGGQGGGGSAGSGQSIFGGSGGSSSTNDKASTVTERGNELVSTIMLTIRPEIWKDNGGTATIVFFHGKLIVTAPRSVQEMIGGPVD